MWRWIIRNEVLIFILAGVVLLRIPTLLEPYWYGDEGIYLVIGQAMRQGSQLYAQIHDNKPPFLYLVAAMANGTQFWFRFITMVWNLATVAMFWQLAKKWFTKSEAVTAVTIIFALLTNIPTFEGNIANAELYFLLTAIGGFYWLYKNKSPFWGGLIIGMGALFKIPALLETGIWPLYWFITSEKQWFKKSFQVGLGAMLPLVVSGIYFFLKGTGKQYLIASGLQNIPYLSSWSAPVSLPIRAAVAAILIFAIYLLRKNLSSKAMLVSLGGVITLFAANLSGRPYPHYLLQLAWVMPLGWGLLVWGKEKERYVFAALASLATITFLVFHYYAYPVAKYYANFGNFVTGRISRQDYFAAFSPDVTRNYQIAKVITAGSMPNERIFVWGDQPMIYALARRLPVGRYTTAYHVFGFGALEETATALENNPPRYIVSFGLVNDFPQLANLIDRHYILESQVDNASVYRRFDRQALKKYNL